MKISVKIEDKTYEVQVGDLNARPIPAEVEGEVFEVWPEESAPVLPHAAAPTPAVPMQAASGSGALTAGGVRAPIPGVISEIKVAEGDSVVYGQELCVLEAMKMKNSIRAGHPGTITKIHVSVSEQVQQGKLLMDLDEKAA